VKVRESRIVEGGRAGNSVAGAEPEAGLKQY
jgi:hypothetical protein